VKAVKALKVMLVKIRGGEVSLRTAPGVVSADVGSGFAYTQQPTQPSPETGSQTQMTGSTWISDSSTSYQPQGCLRPCRRYDKCSH
jgi:hypothetical protein